MSFSCIWIEYRHRGKISLTCRRIVGSKGRRQKKINKKGRIFWGIMEDHTPMPGPQPPVWQAGRSSPWQVPACWVRSRALTQVPLTQLHSVQLELRAGINEQLTNTNINIGNNIVRLSPSLPHCLTARTILTTDDGFFCYFGLQFN